MAAVALLSSGWKASKKSWTRRRVKSQIVKSLNNLTEDEKQILRYYIAFNTRANVLRFTDGVVRGMEHRRIIYRSASVGNLVEGVAYNIGDVAWGYLMEFPEVLDGETNTCRTDRRHYGFL